MIAIKDMEIPKSCVSTQEVLGDIEVSTCPLYNVCKHRDTICINYKLGLKLLWPLSHPTYVIPSSALYSV